MKRFSLLQTVLLLFLASALLQGCTSPAESAGTGIKSESAAPTNTEQTINEPAQATTETNEDHESSNSEAITTGNANEAEEAADAGNALTAMLKNEEAVYLTSEKEDYTQFSKLVLKTNGDFVFLDSLPKGSSKYLGTYSISSNQITLQVDRIPTPSAKELSEIVFTISSANQITLETDVNQVKSGQAYTSVKE